MSSASTAYVEHKPHLKWPYQVRIINRHGRSVMVWAAKTEAHANEKVAELKKSAEE